MCVVWCLIISLCDLVLCLVISLCDLVWCLVTSPCVLSGVSSQALLLSLPQDDQGRMVTIIDGRGRAASLVFFDVAADKVRGIFDKGLELSCSAQILEYCGMT